MTSKIFEYTERLWSYADIAYNAVGGDVLGKAASASIIVASAYKMWRAWRCKGIAEPAIGRSPSPCNNKIIGPAG